MNKILRIKIDTNEHRFERLWLTQKQEEQKTIRPIEACQPLDGLPAFG